MPRLYALAGLAAVLVFLAGCGGGGEAGPVSAPEARDCAELADDAARECYADEFTRRVDSADDAVGEVETITDEARAEGGFLLGNCHGIMHTVGRAYAASHEVTLASLMEHLPPTNDPGCPAGFAHGLVTAVAPQIDLTNPRAAASVCGEAGTRYQRYSCTHGFGHAFMRIHDDELAPALELCRALGEVAPDCAQGAYHDYWFAVGGFDDAEAPADAVTDPRALCAEQPDEFVRPCWYRAYVDNRPEAVAIETTGDIARLCPDLKGLQREACITAATVIGPPDPRVQLALCSGFRGREADACVRGVKVQNLIGQPPEVLLETIRGCDLFGHSSMRNVCYRWLGKTLSVLTDGEFAESGCAELDDAARRACRAGAAQMNDALVTFS